jgi:hypothetical protein
MSISEVNVTSDPAMVGVVTSSFDEISWSFSEVDVTAELIFQK